MKIQSEDFSDGKTKMSDMLNYINSQLCSIEENSRVIKITQRNGNSTEIYELFTENGSCLFLRIPFYTDSSSVNCYVLKQLLIMHIKAPRIIIEKFDIPGYKFPGTIESAVSGKAINIQPPIDNSIIRNFCNDLKQLHSWKIEGYGTLIGQTILKGKHQFFVDNFYTECEYKLRSIVNDKIIRNSDMNTLLSIRDQINKLYENVIPSIVHGDLRHDHIFAENGKYTGMIDFGDTMANDPYFDLAHLKVHSASIFPKVEDYYMKGMNKDQMYKKRMLLLHLYSAIKSYFYGSMDNHNSDEVKNYANLIKDDFVELADLFS